MATFQSTAVVMSNSSDANAQSWMGAVHDLFVTIGGWVQTLDSGQITPSAVTSVNTTGNTKHGYCIYRMADALQAPTPVFVKVYYGTGIGTSSPGLWFTIGTGSDGNGNITGVRYNGEAETAADVSCTASTNSNTSYGSAASNRIVCLFGNTISEASTLFFSLERSKNINGQDTGEGVLFANKTGTTGIDEGRYVVLAAGGQPPVMNGVAVIVDTNNNPSAFSSDVGVGLGIFFKGVAQPPGTQIACVRTSDFLAGATFTMQVYGATRTYLKNFAANLSANMSFRATPGNCPMCIRFD